MRRGRQVFVLEQPGPDTGQSNRAARLQVVEHVSGSNWPVGCISVAEQNQWHVDSAFQGDDDDERQKGPSPIRPMGGDSAFMPLDR